MTTVFWQEFLLRCVAINYAILLSWFGVFVFAHDWLHRMHARWFRLSVESFDALNYGAIAVYKLGIMLLLLTPLLALWLMAT